MHLHLHSISISHTHTRTQSLTLTLVFILAKPTAHANKLTLSTGPHTQIDTSHSCSCVHSHSFDNRPHIAYVFPLTLDATPGHDVLHVAQHRRSRTRVGHRVTHSIWLIIPGAHVHTHSHLFSLISAWSIARIVPRAHVHTHSHLFHTSPHGLSHASLHVRRTQCGAALSWAVTDRSSLRRLS